MEELKGTIVEMLRQIKGIRIQKSNEEEAEQASEEERRSEVDIEGMQTAFGNAFCSVISERFEVLTEGIEPSEGDEFPIPFLLSSDFADHFQDVLRRHFIPDLAHRCKGILTRAETEAQNSVEDFFLEYFESKQGRENMWAQWQSCWKEMAVYREKPPEPVPEKKKSLLSALKKKKARPKYFTKVYTPEEWKEEVKKTDKLNKKVDGVWADLIEDKGTYVPPEEELDNDQLVNIFARSAKGMQDQIAAIMQIVTQSENLGSAFDAYQTNKNLGLSLMAISFKDAKQFLGKKALLKDLLKGHNARAYPLIARFMPGQVRSS